MKKLTHTGVMLAVMVCLTAALLRADTITLNDGTVLRGRTIRQSDGYWIKLDDGTTQTISSDQIRGVQKETPAAAPGDSADGSLPAAASPAVSSSLALVQRKAELVRAPIAAVAIWQQFIDSKPAPSDEDLKVAREQLAKWQQMADNGAMRVKGRWITGDEYKQVHAELQELMKDYMDLLRQNETLAAVKKLEAAYAIYPDSARITFELGYVSMLEHDEDKAIRYFTESLRAQPGLSAATGNIGLCLIQKRKLIEGILKLQDAAQQGDSASLWHDMTLALSRLAPEQRENERLKPAVETQALLAAKYSSLESKFLPDKYVLLVVTAAPVAGGSRMWSGTGFLISGDGLILTNRHVAKDAKTLMVTVDGGAHTSANVVAIDDEQDLALLRISADISKHAELKFAAAQAPAAGADCTVMGFPLADRLGANIKVTHGIVTGVQSEGLDADVLVDAKVNPGNSGGPMLDKNGNVMAIVCMKTLSSSAEDTYGIGISAGLIRRFLEKNKVSAPEAEGAGTALSTEDIAAKAKPAVVMIFATQ
jgi:S1-C subfamily serine protease